MIAYLALVLCVFAYTATAGDVVSVTDATWKKEVLGSQLPVFVKFYAPWCGHCKSLAPVWEKVATNLKGLVKVAEVDCTVEQALCGKFQIQGYPTLKLFKDGGKAVDYQQGRDASTLVKFATEQIPNHVTSIKSESDLTTFLAKSESLPHVLLFSQKNLPSPLFKAMSTIFKGKLAFGQVASTVTAVVKKYDIDSYPKIIVLQGEEKKVYDGGISVAALQQYLSGFAGEEAVPEETAAPKPTPPKPTVEPATWIKATAENLEAECGKLCILAIINEPDAEQQSILDKVISNFKRDKKFKFVLVPIEEPFIAKFGITGSQASLVVYHPKRHRFAKPTEFKFNSIVQLVERVLGGDATYADAN